MTNASPTTSPDRCSRTGATEASAEQAESATFDQRYRVVITLLMTAVLALLPVGQQIAAAFRSDPLPPLNINKSRPSLLFATYMYHHGTDPVELSSTLESRFVFRNEGTEPVVIGEIERSCGCMSPRLTQREVAPGERGEILVPIATVNQTPGFHEYTLTVHYNDPQPRRTTLTIKATFPEQMVVVQPRALYLSQKTDRTIPFQVSVSDFREQRLKVTGIQSSTPYVKVNLQAETKNATIQQTAFADHDAGSVFRINGEVQPSIPSGRHDVLLVAQTDDPDYAMLTVPMLLNGPARPSDQQVTVSPPQLRIPITGMQVIDRTFEVLLNLPADWKISQATAWPEQLDVEFDNALSNNSEPQPEGRQDVPVRVRLSALPEFPVKDGVIHLSANDNRDLVTIKVNFHWP